jgi:hypothetical protein
MCVTVFPGLAQQSVSGWYFGSLDDFSVTTAFGPSLKIVACGYEAACSFEALRHLPFLKFLGQSAVW